MDKRKSLLFFSIVLMFMSGLMLFGAVLYYDLVDKVTNQVYSSKEEYEDITDGLSFLNTLPIHFNIINKYFSNFDYLSQEDKEAIVMGYVVKNKYGLYECGASIGNKEYLCINKETLNSDELLSIFNSNFKFTSDEIKLYLDDYGASSIKTDMSNAAYRIVLNNNYNNSYRLYSEFYKYKKENDVYVFYLYQGYYMGNCKKGEDLSLYDFMTGDEVYLDRCNGNNNFEVAPGDKIDVLQLYKYELKKDKNGKFYLYGYNPVNNVS